MGEGGSVAAPSLTMLRVVLAVLLFLPVVHAQGYDRPRRAITVDLVGPYVLGVGVSYEQGVAGPLAARGGGGVRDASLFGSGGDPAATISGVVLTGGHWFVLEGGVGVTGSLRDSAWILVPHALAGVRLSLPLGSGLDGSGPIPRDLLLRLNAVVLNDPGLRCCASPPRGSTFFVLPSLSVGLAF